MTGFCDCLCHVNPFDYVPVCPRHRLPLHAAEAGYGQCPWTGPPRRRRTIGGEPAPPNRCTVFPPASWGWSPRDLFNGADLPPYNGHLPPRMPALAGPHWRRERRACPECSETKWHLFGDNRRVCTGCGRAVWAESDDQGSWADQVRSDPWLQPETDDAS